MEETNKSLALLLVAAIIVSLGGTIVSLNKLGEIQLTGITGRATTGGKEGFVTLNITEETIMTVMRSMIDFGNGYVNSTCDNCTMWTNSSTGGKNYSDSECCVGEWRTLGVEADTGIWVQNQGNTNLTVNMDLDKNAASFIGGATPSPEFQIRIMNDSNARTPTGTSSALADDTIGSCDWNYTGGDPEHTWRSVSTDDPVICPDYLFGFDSAADEFVIDVRLVVPRLAVAADQTATITLTGTSQ